MEQLLKIIDTLCELLTVLVPLTLTEREELVPDFKTCFNEWATVLLKLDRIVKGCTPWGLPIEWGVQPWQQPTYRKQAGLTLHAGWEDIIDPGIDLKPVELIEEPIYLRTSVGATDTTLGIDRRGRITDTCKAGYFPRALNIAFETVEQAVNLDSDSSEDLLGLSFIVLPDERESTPDSLPDLEDVIPPPPTAVRRVLRGHRRRHYFPRPPPTQPDQPWREVLNLMLTEQEVLGNRETRV